MLKVFKVEIVDFRSNKMRLFFGDYQTVCTPESHSYWMECSKQVVFGAPANRKCAYILPNAL